MNKKPASIVATIGAAILIVIGAKFFLLEKSVSETLVRSNVAGRQMENDILQEEVLPEETENIEPPVQEQEKTEEATIVSPQKQSQQNTIKDSREESKVDEDEDEDEDEDDEKKNDFSQKSHLVSFGYEKYGGERKIDTIVVHSTFCVGDDPFDLDCALSQFKDYGVSSHYIIDRDGEVFLLVKENDIAYHAGQSQTPDGRNNVNGFSIGIELVNSKESQSTSNQYSSLNELIKNLKQKYSIKYTLGHKDIAPGRKTDPWNFDWGKIQ